MSITQSRIDKENRKKKKRSRRATILITLVSLVLTGLALAGSYQIYKQWSDSKSQWDKSSFKGKLSDLPAEFVKNNISADMADDVNSLTDVTKVLDEVKANKGLSSANIDKARKAVSRSEKILKHYKLETGEAKTAQD